MSKGHRAYLYQNDKNIYYGYDYELLRKVRNNQAISEKNDSV
jgi:hypothetical protein